MTTLESLGESLRTLPDNAPESDRMSIHREAVDLLLAGPEPDPDANIRATLDGILLRVSNPNLKEADRQAAKDEFWKLNRKEASRLRAPEPVPVPRVQSDLPKRLLWAHGKSGAVLSAGTVAVLAGEGGIGKSALAGSIALGIAMQPDGEVGDVSGGLFEGVGGKVLLASHEDGLGVTAWRLRKLAGNAGEKKAASEDLARVHLLDLAGWPLFGPSDAGRGALYNARPEPLAGWSYLWSAADRIGPRLVVIDPALSAFVGEPNAAAPVTEFLVSLADAAKKRRCGVLLLAHSTKAARAPRTEKPDPFDPGHVSGTAAWTDRVRGVLAFTWEKEQGKRVLAVSKANYGPARIQIGLEPIRDPRKSIVGFKARGTWGEKAPAADDRRKVKGV